MSWLDKVDPGRPEPWESPGDTDKMRLRRAIREIKLMREDMMNALRKAAATELDREGIEVIRRGLAEHRRRMEIETPPGKDG